MTKEELLLKACSGDKEALIFVCRLDGFLKDARKLIIAGEKDRHKTIALFAQTNTVFSLPFYVRNAHLLQLPVMRALRELMTNDPMPDLVWNVAMLKLGFDGARKLLAKPAETE